MRQVSGEQCVACRRPIAGDEDGAFCDGCRNPVHDRCRRPEAATSDRACCAVCGVHLLGAAKHTQAGSAVDYTDYTQVPWHRQSGVNNLFIALALFGCLPLAFWTCYNLLTGDVYFNAREPDGALKKWGIINKVWAFAFAVGWILVVGTALWKLAIGPD